MTECCVKHSAPEVTNLFDDKTFPVVKEKIDPCTCSYIRWRCLDEWVMHYHYRWPCNLWQCDICL